MPVLEGGGFSANKLQPLLFPLPFPSPTPDLCLFQTKHALQTGASTIFTALNIDGIDPECLVGSPQWGPTARPGTPLGFLQPHPLPPAGIGHLCLQGQHAAQPGP